MPFLYKNSEAIKNIKNKACKTDEQSMIYAKNEINEKNKKELNQKKLENKINRKIVRSVVTENLTEDKNKTEPIEPISVTAKLGSFQRRASQPLFTEKVQQMREIRKSFRRALLQQQQESAKSTPSIRKHRRVDLNSTNSSFQNTQNYYGIQANTTKKLPKCFHFSDDKRKKLKEISTGICQSILKQGNLLQTDRVKNSDELETSKNHVRFSGVT